jgi:hypothetical protein
MASGAILLGAWAREGRDSVTIDRSFLDQIVGIRNEGGAAWDRAGELVWENMDEMVYLARKGDRRAIRAVQHLFTLGGVPGGCACSEHELARCVFGGATLPEEFLEELALLAPADQAAVLVYVDYGWSRGMACDSCWLDERNDYIKAHRQVLAFYKPDGDEVPPLHLDDAAAEASQPNATGGS